MWWTQNTVCWLAGYESLLLLSFPSSWRKERDRVWNASTDLDRQREQAVLGERDNRRFSHFFSTYPTTTSLGSLSLVSCLSVSSAALSLTDRQAPLRFSACVGLPPPHIFSGRFPPFFYCPLIDLYIWRDEHSYFQTPTHTHSYTYAYARKCPPYAFNTRHPENL